jgi:hypothetical protein
VAHLFASYVQRWPSARTPRAKLLLIDDLIHEFHVIQDGFGRPVGVNVIQGTTRDVSALIEGLAYGLASTPGLRETRQRWAARQEAKGRWLSVSDMRAIARELGIVGYSRMRRDELKAAIERAAAEHTRHRPGPVR